MAISYKPELQYSGFQDLSDQVRFQSTEGKIWFGEQRMLLMQVSAMASLRRELINMVWINEWGALGEDTEEGGSKQSGLGRLNGVAAIEDFTEIRTITLNPGLMDN